MSSQIVGSLTWLAESRQIALHQHCCWDAEGCRLQAETLITKKDANLGGNRLLAQITAKRVVEVSDQVMKKITGLEAVEKLDLVVEVPTPSYRNLLEAGGPRTTRLLALDGVQDPGNMGTVLRSAVAFGWEGVHLLPGCCDPFNDKALRASRGAAFKVPLSRGPWQQLRQAAQTHGLHLIAACPENPPSTSTSPTTLLQHPSTPTGSGSSLDELLADSAPLQTPPAAPSRSAGSEPSPSTTTAAGVARSRGAASGSAPGVCLVLGSEGQGLSPEVAAGCSPVSIPMAPGMESLNVGIAGGILMFLLSEGAPQLQQRLHALTSASAPEDQAAM